MKQNVQYIILLVIILFGSCQKEKNISLFDGRTFNGWDGNKKVFRIENGSIIGGSFNKPLQHSYYLSTTKKYSDFHLKLKVKILDKDSLGNAGVSFRAKRVPNSHEVAAYQADLGYGKAKEIKNFSNFSPKDTISRYPLWGCLVDECREDNFRYPKPEWFPVVFLQLPNREIVEKTVKQEGWNELEIIAIGNHIKIKLNGIQTVDFKETANVAKEGYICLQVHNGEPFEVHYKDIEITTY